MINRVDIQKLVDAILSQEKTTRERPTLQGKIKEVQTEGVKVELSEIAREKMNLSELEKKISEIKSMLEKNEYRVDPEKIFEGLSKYLSIFEK